MLSVITDTLNALPTAMALICYTKIVELIKLEKVEISDALPLEAARPGSHPRVRLRAPETIC